MNCVIAVTMKIKRSLQISCKVVMRKTSYLGTTRNQGHLNQRLPIAAESWSVQTLFREAFLWFA